MTTVAALPSNKRRKTGLPPPCFYNDLYSSYRVEWEARKRKFPPSMEVTSLCHIPNNNNNNNNDVNSNHGKDNNDSPALLLVGMSNGSLSIFRQFGQRSQSEEQVLDQQVARGREVDYNNPDQESSDDGDEESFGWKFVGSRQLGEGALTFLHATSMSAKESVVLAGSVDGLWWWNSLADLLQSVSETSRPGNGAPPPGTKGKKSARRSSKTQTVHHDNDISIAKAAANDSDFCFSTPDHELYHISIPSLITITNASSKKTPSDWLQEIPMPDKNDSNNSDDGDYEVTTLHLTAPRNTGDSPAAGSSSSLLLIGTNQSKVLCWDVLKEAYTLEPLDLSTIPEELSASTNAFGGDDYSVGGGGEASIRVTAMTSIHADWWTISGTIVWEPLITKGSTAGFRNNSRRAGHNNNNNSNKRPVNFLGTWHGPSKSRTQLVSKIPEKIQGLMVASGKLYSIGNLSVVTVWESPYQLERLHRISTNAKSNKAICSTVHDTLAVAGVGTKVDLVQSAVRLESVDLLQTVN